MTIDHSVKQYIDESLPALLEKSGNLVLWKVVTLSSIQLYERRLNVCSDGCLSVKGARLLRDNKEPDGSVNDDDED